MENFYDCGQKKRVFLNFLTAYNVQEFRPVKIRKSVWVTSRVSATTLVGQIIITETQFGNSCKIIDFLFYRRLGTRDVKISGE
jgi:hypothetical protein